MQSKLMNFIKKKWYLFAFFVVVCFSVGMTVQVSRTILDGDTSSALYRAYVMACENNLFTTNFYGVTELRLFDISFFLAPFFKLFSNWTIVRICGDLLIQALYVLSFQYMVAPFLNSKASKWIASGLLLMPFSTVYARIVLYHFHYIVYIIYLFLLLGMLLRFLYMKNERPLKRCVRFVLMAALWIVVGLNGVRHMMILLAPLLALSAVYIVTRLKAYRSNELCFRGENSFLKQPPVRFLGLLMLSTGFYLIGFILNQEVLLPYYDVGNMSQSALMPIGGPVRFAFIFNSFMAAIGFRTASASVISARSVALASALLSFGYLFWAAFHYGFQDAMDEKAFEKKILYGFCPAAFILTTFIFVFDQSERWYELYYVPVIVTVYPVLALEIDRLTDQALSCARKLLIYLCCFVFLFQGGYTAAYVFHKNDSPLDIWSGLAFREVMVVDCVQDCVDYMRDNGYAYGMAPYWYANVMVELSDATLTIAPYEALTSDEPIEVYEWATSKTAFQLDKLPSTLIIFVASYDREAFEYVYPDGEEVFTGAFFSAMEVDTVRIFPDYQGE